MNMRQSPQQKILLSELSLIYIHIDDDSCFKKLQLIRYASHLDLREHKIKWISQWLLVYFSETFHCYFHVLFKLFVKKYLFMNSFLPFCPIFYSYLDFGSNSFMLHLKKFLQRPDSRYVTRERVHIVCDTDSLEFRAIVGL